MKKSRLICLFILLFHCISNSFNIPKFYHGKIFLEETRFSEDALTSLDILVAGGSKRFCWQGYTGRLDFSEIIFQFYQNFYKGFFFHAYIPTCWIKINDIERSVCPGIDRDLGHCFSHTDIYSPTLLAGWTLNYEDTQRLDFIDATLELGAVLPTPRKATTVPLFPIGYTTQAGFAAAGYTALGSLEWLTTGLYGQAIVFRQGCIWSTGSYLTLDHIIPHLSFTAALCGDGQNKTIGEIASWQMLSLYLSGEVDLASDKRPWLPRIKAFFSKPLAGHNIFKAGLGGVQLRIDAQIFF